MGNLFGYDTDDEAPSEQEQILKLPENQIYLD